MPVRMPALIYNQRCDEDNISWQILGSSKNFCLCYYVQCVWEPLWDFFPPGCSRSTHQYTESVAGVAAHSLSVTHLSWHWPWAWTSQTSVVGVGRPTCLPSQLCCVGDPQGPGFPCLLTPIIVIHDLWERSLRRSRFLSISPVERWYFVLSHYVLLIRDHISVALGPLLALTLKPTAVLEGKQQYRFFTR